MVILCLFLYLVGFVATYFVLKEGFDYYDPFIHKIRSFLIAMVWPISVPTFLIITSL